MNDRDIVKNSIDAIEPKSGAKERMLKSIKTKAAAKPEAKAERKKTALRYLPLVACLALIIVGVSLLPKDEGIALLSDDTGARSAYHDADRVEYVDGIDELISALGIEPVLPEDAEIGSCTILDGSTADVRFEWHHKSFELLCAKQQGDIPELPGEKTASGFIGSAELCAIKNDDGTYLALTWERDGVLHCVISAECSSDDMRMLYYSLP